MEEPINLQRRSIFKIGIAAMAYSFIAKPSIATVTSLRGEKRLSFYNLHTDEQLKVTYWKNGNYLRPAFEKINYILRDHRTGDIFPIRAGLMDLLHDLQTYLGHHDVIEIISGYRSPKTNAMLAKASDGVAKQSLHTEGKAIDIRLHGVSLRQLHTAALFLRRGGVGYYPSSGFVHVDIGRVRRW